MTSKVERLIAILALTILLLGSCGFARSGDTAAEDQGPGSYGDPSLLEDDEESGGGDGGSDGSGNGSGSGGSGGSGTSSGSGGSGGSGSGSGGSDFTQRKAIDKWQDFDSLGSATRSILRSDSSFKEVEVRFFFSPDAKPSDFAVAELRKELNKTISKKVTVDLGGTLPSQTKNFSDSDIRSFTTQQRNKSGFLSDYPSKLRIWVGYVDNEHSSRPVLGQAFQATSVIVFPEEWRDTLLAVSPQAIERATLIHEVGHLLAMTEIGYKTDRDHRDCDHGPHNRFDDSIMYWAAETLNGLEDMLSGGTLNFDDNDRHDLSNLAAGKEQADPSGNGSC